MRERTVKGISNLIAASVALLAGSAPALANLCEEGRNPPQRYLDEADALQNETFTAAGYAGSKAYDARVLTCNRRRDTLGNDVDQAIAAKHTFAATLPPLLVKGHIRYLGTILGEVRYGYELRRDGGTWKVTVPAQFYLPGRDDQALDVPLLLAVKPTKDGGMGIVCDSQAHPKVITNPGLGDEFQACRVGRGERFGGQRPDTLLFKYWKQEIERFWTRPGFTVVVRIVNLGEVDDITLKGYEKENIVWPVRFNDRPESRATYKAVVGKAHPLFSGLPATTFVHEFGHVMGNDDEYPEPAPVVGGTPPPWRDCPALGGTDYIMCDKPSAPPATNAKGLYAWIATRRYAVADPSRYQCKTSSDCPDGRFCDTGTLNSGPNLCVPARPECAACDADKQCLAPMTCAGKPLGRCARSESRPIGTACCRDDQCGSKSCNSGGHCQCMEDAQCPPGQFCALGTLNVGQNRCLPLHVECEACSADKQCRPPATCKGEPVGKCATPGAISVGSSCCRDEQCRSGSCSTFSRLCQCASDRDCPSGQHCDEGTLGFGHNQCVSDTKALCAACSSDGVCAPPMACIGKPFGHCAARSSVELGRACCADDQCKSQKCQGGLCTCGDDRDCPGKKCKKPLVGANHCE